MVQDNSKIVGNSRAQGKTNSDRMQPDAPTINDSKATVTNNNLQAGELQNTHSKS